MTAPEPPPDAARWRTAIERALGGVGVWTVFQVIVDLRRRSVVGYEALSRFDDAVVSASPDEWFRQAAALGHGPALEASTLQMALAHRATLPKNCFLSVNVDPENLRHPAVRDVLSAHGDLQGVVIEFTEHHAWEWARLEETVRVLKRHGARLALDDAGTGHSGLRQMLQLRPAFVKLDRRMIKDLDADEAKIALVEMLGVLADRLDAWILAEGVETLAEAHTLQRLGVPLAQGWYFGRPGQAWPVVDRVALKAIDSPPPVRGPGLHRLVDAVPPVHRGDPVGTGWLASNDAWQPVIDVHDRPVGLIHPTAGGFDVLVETLVVNVSTTPHQVAARIATGEHGTSTPVAVTDDCGRYVGLLRVERLLAHLGTPPPA